MTFLMNPWFFRSFIGAACGPDRVFEVKAEFGAKWGVDFHVVEDVEDAFFAN